MKKITDAEQTHQQNHRIPSAVRDLLVGYHKSTLTQRQFANSSGIGLSTLQRYLRFQRDPNFKGYRQKAQPKRQPIPRLLEVALPSVSSMADNAPWQWQLRLANGTVLQGRDWPQRHQLQPLLQALEEAC
jgi:hypothetical protein